LHCLGKDGKGLLLFVAHGMSQGLQDLHLDNMVQELLPLSATSQRLQAL
jgi:hypothetical protein